ncbi:MAG TPA: hypothetical protein PKC28_08445 [Bdellovibrionales bacterium]|nr:hypothetical protein [Bdellovibrionales bacterium]
MLKTLLILAVALSGSFAWSADGDSEANSAIVAETLKQNIGICPCNANQKPVNEDSYAGDLQKISSIVGETHKGDGAGPGSSKSTR